MITSRGGTGRMGHGNIPIKYNMQAAEKQYLLKTKTTDHICTFAPI